MTNGERQGWLNRMRKDIWLKTNGDCIYCGKHFEDSRDREWHVDHKTPLIAGGTDDLDNLWVACSMCNITKGGKTAEEYRDFLTSGIQKRIRKVLELTHKARPMLDELEVLKLLDALYSAQDIALSLPPAKFHFEQEGNNE